MKAGPAIQRSDAAQLYAQQSKNLSLLPQDDDNPKSNATAAVQAKFITPRDPVIETANGGRLPAVPLDEAEKLNRFKDEAELRSSRGGEHAIRKTTMAMAAEQETEQGSTINDDHMSNQSTKAEAPL
ncbi:MAG: hypothetical protein L6R41_004644, partial [Letrouitia leprolyta]